MLIPKYTVGPIDPALEKSLRVNMAPMINWVRGLAWETYELLQSIAKIGFEAFNLSMSDFSSFGTAFAKFADCQDAFRTACFNNPRLADFER